MSMNQIKIGGRYRHHKGHEYVVLAFGRDSATLEDVVVYQGQYHSDEFGDKPVWTRPIDEFTEEVVKRGVTVKRFEYLRDE